MLAQAMDDFVLVDHRLLATQVIRGPVSFLAAQKTVCMVLTADWHPGQIYAPSLHWPLTSMRLSASAQEMQ